MKNRWLIWAIVGLVAVAGAYLALKPSTQAQGTINVDAGKVQQLLGDAADLRIVDVRTAAEFDAGHLKGAENVPVDQVESAVSGWDRTQALLVYCATGARSIDAVRRLEAMGFKTIYHFNSGLVAWQGGLDTGAAQQVAQGPSIKTNGTPVVYEFFTEW